MYSLRMPFRKVQARIKRLAKDGYHPEAFVASVFTTERILRRTLLQLVISAGFTTDQAFRIVKKLRGLDAIKKEWSLYDPQKRSLVDVVGNTNWQVLKKAAEIRNSMIHGLTVPGNPTCRRKTKEVIAVQDNIREALKNAYGFWGWRGLDKRSLGHLHVDPKVRI